MIRLTSDEIEDIAKHYYETNSQSGRSSYVIDNMIEEFVEDIQNALEKKNTDTINKTHEFLRQVYDESKDPLVKTNIIKLWNILHNG